jgi:hypothetical protein
MMTALPTKDDIYKSQECPDPREMSIEALAGVGHEKISATKAIRAKCLDCCGDNAAEVRRCHIVDCSLWPFRMGSSPFRPKLSEDEKQRRAAVARKNLPRGSGETQTERAVGTI